jgi:hypothetical protein
MKKVRGEWGRPESIYHPDDLDARQLREPKVIKHPEEHQQNIANKK